MDKYTLWLVQSAIPHVMKSLLLVMVFLIAHYGTGPVNLFT